MTTKDKGIKAINLLQELRLFCYDDIESTDEFDDLHDELYYQILGLNESLCEAEEDDWSDIYDSEFQDALDLANEIKAYREEQIKLPIKDRTEKEFNWIYA